MPVYKTDEKKDGLQKYRVRINYTDGTGRYKQLERVAYGKEAAKRLERELFLNLKAETTSRLTLNDVFYNYVSAQKNEVKKTTLNKTSGVLKRFVLSELGRYRLGYINAELLQKWRNKLAGTDYSVTYKNNIFNAFCALLNFAVKMEYIDKNPLSALGKFKDVTHIDKEMNYYTAAEFQRFISAAEAIAQTSEDSTGNIFEWNFYVFFMLAFFAGMRKGEIYALRWSDIYDNVIHIRRSIAQQISGEDVETPPKNKSSVRNIQIPQPLNEALTAHYERCRGIDGFTDEWYICGGIKPIRNSTVSKHNKKYANAAEIKTIRIHDYRHSHASLLVNNGINIQEVARRLGHARVEQTWNTYSHLYPHEEEKALTVLNNLNFFRG